MTPDTTPDDILYTKDHEWVRRDGNTITVGITAHAVDQLGDITMIGPKRVGTRLAAGDVACDIDSVKVAAQLYSPVDGVIVAVNQDLDSAPEAVNQDPYGAGWMIQLELADPSQLGALLSPSAYRDHLASGG